MSSKRLTSLANLWVLGAYAGPERSLVFFAWVTFEGAVTEADVEVCMEVCMEVDVVDSTALRLSFLRTLLSGQLAAEEDNDIKVEKDDEDAGCPSLQVLFDKEDNVDLFIVQGGERRRSYSSL